MIRTIRNLTYTLAGLIAFGFFDGFLGLNLSEDLYVLVGFAMIGCIIWLTVLISKDEFKQLQ